MVSIRSWQRLTLRGSITSWPVPYLETGRREEPHRYQRLAVLRAEQGLSRQELASTLGTDYQTVGYLERGAYDPSLHPAFQISEDFELPIEGIFSRTPFGRMSVGLYGHRAGEPGPLPSE